MNTLITSKPLTKITLFSGETVYTIDPIEKVASEVQKQHSVYLKWIEKLIHTSTIKLVEVACPVEKFEYYDMDKLPVQVRNLLKEKIQQTRENGKTDTITPEVLTRWIETIREHISYYQETKRDNSPEAIERRRKQIEATKAKLAQKLWTSTPS